jgi:hypothetical protein
VRRKKLWQVFFFVSKSDKRGQKMGEIVSWLVVLSSFGNGNKIAAVEGKTSVVAGWQMNRHKKPTCHYPEQITFKHFGVSSYDRSNISSIDRFMHASVQCVSAAMQCCQNKRPYFAMGVSYTRKMLMKHTTGISSSKVSHLA